MIYNRSIYSYLGFIKKQSFVRQCSQLVLPISRSACCPQQQIKLNHENKYSFYSTKSISNSNNSNNSNININTKIREFSFNVENIVRKGDQLALGYTDIRKKQQSISFYKDAIAATNDKVERGIIYFRLASVKFRMGLLDDAKLDIRASLSFLPFQHPQTYKSLTLLAYIMEYELELLQDPSKQQQQEKLTRIEDAWKAVIECDATKPDGYTGLARCLIRSTEIDPLALINKALMCDPNHVPSLLLAYDVFDSNKKYKISNVTISLFLKHYKEFYATSFIYHLLPVDLYFIYQRKAEFSLKSERYKEAIEWATLAFNIVQHSINNKHTYRPSSISPDQLTAPTPIMSIQEQIQQQGNSDSSNNNTHQLQTQRQPLIVNLEELQRQQVNPLLEQQMGLGGNDHLISSYSNIHCIGKDFLPLYFLRGQAYLYSQQYKEAIDDMTSVIQLDSQHINAFKMRAEAYRSQGDLISYSKDQKVILDYKTKLQERRQEAVNAYVEKQERKDIREKAYFERYLQEDGDNDDDDYDEEDGEEEDEN
ncbi:hypothetical protein CYY_000406 [Polysphondylium violaceum]|uniref:Tetratricopeptide-like helical domain-containing protein n=1 Tax=Polysphondylium violaceum TaxID=133409 RepID=A0A8J4VBL4_9MYCE|nr:hypothetical protein CYY_000406 [Polysphondylium violaceum]